jgi:hypothetical protein
MVKRTQNKRNKRKQKTIKGGALCDWLGTCPKVQPITPDSQFNSRFDESQSGLSDQVPVVPKPITQNDNKIKCNKYGNKYAIVGLPYLKFKYGETVGTMLYELRKKIDELCIVINASSAADQNLSKNIYDRFQLIQYEKFVKEAYNDVVDRMTATTECDKLAQMLAEIEEKIVEHNETESDTKQMSEEIKDKYNKMFEVAMKSLDCVSSDLSIPGQEPEIDEPSLGFRPSELDEFVPSENGGTKRKMTHKKRHTKKQIRKHNKNKKIIKLI